MYEKEARELARRAYALASLVEWRCEGNGVFHREYTIGEVSLTIEGWSVDSNIKATGLFIDTGVYVADEVIDLDFEVDNVFTGNEPINILANGAAIPRILELVRQRMVLEDLADV